MSADVIPTMHARMVRGATKIFDRIFRDDLSGQPVDLTNAVVNYAVRADQKVDPSIHLTSQLPATLLVGIFNSLGTVATALEAGRDISVELVADASLSLTESLITSGLLVTGRKVSIHYVPGTTTIAQLANLINTTSTLIQIQTLGSPSYVLQVGDTFALTPLTGGPPTGWRTGVFIDPDQDSHRGHYQIILIPSDTAELDALGDDDPWFHESEVVLGGETLTDFGTSKLAIYPQTIG